MTVSTYQRARWIRDLLRFLPLKSQFVLSGNVRDLQIGEVQAGNATWQPLVSFLAAELRAYGAAEVLIYEPTTGFRVAGGQGQNDSRLLTELGLAPTDGIAPAGLELFAETLHRNESRTAEPVPVIVDFASRLVVRPDNLSAAENHAFSRLVALSHRARLRTITSGKKRIFNSIIWVTEKEGDLPDWLVVDNPRIRSIAVPVPDRMARRVLGGALLATLQGENSDDESKLIDEFVERTEGLLLYDMVAIAQLGQAEGLKRSEIADAVRRYKVGVTEDPWQKLDREKIRNGDRFLRQFIKGQDHAIVHALDIIKRAITGFAAHSSSGRPRGVMFLAGPTGVGKTELAKSITRLLFGDPSAYIRFDMSEFSAEHSDQRLLGAPPGYIGYDVGGELTNAVREKPFSVILFDEIEKAHPRILDKFLQILGDGVLTSGRGDRVYFSEAIIIFTSNLGIYRMDEVGRRQANVSPASSFDEVQQKVRSEIEDHFKRVLNRPEILNRIGDNIVVFDFIRENTAVEIYESMVEAVFKEVRSSSGFKVNISQPVNTKLRRICLEDLSNGGRGIRNKIETHLINPLARALFERSDQTGEYTITGIENGPSTGLDLTVKTSQ